MEQIQQSYGLLKETIIVIMMLYKNTKARVHSPDDNSNFFNFVTGVLQRDTLAPHMFVICLDYVLLMSIDLIKENGFTLKKIRSRQYSVETMTDTD